MAQGTMIHGIAASENLDSSGEIVSISGMDSSFLTKDGVINWAHKSESPSQVVGKIIYEKKIFSPEDCENDYQLYFWKKCGVPYLYIVGELFDGQGHSTAMDLAAMFRYDAANKGKDTSNVISFSVEGSKISKEGNVITRSIARKVTCDPLPCNKVAIAEMVAIEAPKPKKADIDDIFKTEIETQAELFKGEVARVKKDEGFTMGTLSASELKKDQPKLAAVTSAPTSIGQTRSGKPISATARVHEYTNFSESDHRDAANAHLGMATKLGETDFKQAQSHRNKGLLHTSAANTLMDRSKRLDSNVRPKMNSTLDKTLDAGSELKKEMLRSPSSHASSMKTKNTKPNPESNRRSIVGGTVSGFSSSIGGFGGMGSMGKALDAGSSMAAPSQLVGGAALAKEALKAPSLKVPTIKPPTAGKGITLKPGPAPNPGKVTHKPGATPNPGKVIQKSQALLRAEQEYQKWSKREEYESFMAKRLPHLTKGEIRAIGQVMALNKSMTLEKALEDIISLRKSE